MATDLGRRIRRVRLVRTALNRPHSSIVHIHGIYMFRNKKKCLALSLSSLLPITGGHS